MTSWRRCCACAGSVRPGGEIGLMDKGGPSRAASGDVRPAKRVTHASASACALPSARVLSSDSPSPPARRSASTPPSATMVVGCDAPQGAEGGVGLFRIAGMGLEESSADSTPSHINAGGSKNTWRAPLTLGISCPRFVLLC